MRALARIFRWLGGAAWALAWALFALWLIGRVFTDRWHATQYCYWLPTAPALGASCVMAFCGWSLRWAAGHGRGVPARMRTRADIAFLIVMIASGLYSAFVEYRVLSSLPESGKPEFRVIHWNASSGIGDRWVRSLLDRNLDLIVINPASYQRFAPLVDGYQPASTVWRHGFAVITKHRVVRTGTIDLGIEAGAGFDPREDANTLRKSDPGRAIFLELDTAKLLGRNLIVWCLDLPSDISLHRRRVAEEAAEAIAAFSGPVEITQSDGSFSKEIPATKGFPPPDLVLGDLNTPRGSGSLKLLTAGLTNAYDAAGSGGCATWPYRCPVWHLDQMFMAGWLRTTRYAAVDLGGGTHLAQYGEFTPTSAP